MKDDIDEKGRGTLKHGNNSPPSTRYRNKNFLPKLTAALSPSSSEPAVEFVRRQSRFCKDLVILTKFWQQSVSYTNFISGRSFLFECIAIR